MATNKTNQPSINVVNSNNSEAPDRRKLLGLAVGGAVAPLAWKSPIVESVVLPVHAATTGDGGDPTGGDPECLGQTMKLDVCYFQEGEDLSDTDGVRLSVRLKIMLPDTCCDTDGAPSFTITAPPAIAGLAIPMFVNGQQTDGTDTGCAAFAETERSLNGVSIFALDAAPFAATVDAGECGGVCPVATTIRECR